MFRISPEIRREAEARIYRSENRKRSKLLHRLGHSIPEEDAPTITVSSNTNTTSPLGRESPPISSYYAKGKMRHAKQRQRKSLDHLATMKRSYSPSHNIPGIGSVIPPREPSLAPPSPAYYSLPVESSSGDMCGGIMSGTPVTSSGRSSSSEMPPTLQSLSSTPGIMSGLPVCSPSHTAFPSIVSGIPVGLSGVAGITSGTPVSNLRAATKSGITAGTPVLNNYRRHCSHDYSGQFFSGIPICNGSHVCQYNNNSPGITSGIPFRRTSHESVINIPFTRQSNNSSFSLQASTTGGELTDATGHAAAKHVLNVVAPAISAMEISDNSEDPSHRRFCPSSIGNVAEESRENVSHLITSDNSPLGLAHLSISAPLDSRNNNSCDTRNRLFNSHSRANDSHQSFDNNFQFSCNPLRSVTDATISTTASSLDHHPYLPNADSSVICLKSNSNDDSIDSPVNNSTILSPSSSSSTITLPPSPFYAIQQQQQQQQQRCNYQGSGTSYITDGESNGRRRKTGLATVLECKTWPPETSSLFASAAYRERLSNDSLNSDDSFIQSRLTPTHSASVLLDEEEAMDTTTTGQQLER